MAGAGGEDEEPMPWHDDHSMRRHHDDADADDHDDPAAAPSESGDAAEAAPPDWKSPLTVRALFFSSVIAVISSTVVVKVTISQGIMLPIDVTVGFISFFICKSWVAALDMLCLIHKPLTTQESTVIVACALAATNTAYLGGWGTYVPAMTKGSAAFFGETDISNLTTMEPNVRWMIPYYMACLLAGIASIIPFAKVLLTRGNLTFLPGYAMATLLKSFHVPRRADKLTKEKSWFMMKSFGAAFAFELYQWLFSGGVNCGIVNLPIFGLFASSKGITLGCDPAAVGTGMLSPRTLGLSGMFGALFAVSFFLPLVNRKQGIWYQTNEESYIYTPTIALGITLGNGVFQMIFSTLLDRRRRHRERSSHLVLHPDADAGVGATTGGDQGYGRGMTLFAREHDALFGASVAAYFLVPAVSAVALAVIFRGSIPAAAIAGMFALGTLIAYSSAYSVGRAGFSQCIEFGHEAVFVFGAIVGFARGGLVTGMIAGGVSLIMSYVAGQVMECFMLALLTETSPRSIIAAMLVGTVVGAATAPPIYVTFFHALGLDVAANPSESMEAMLYRKSAVRIAKLRAFPDYCVAFGVAAFVGAVAVNVVKEVARSRGWRWWRYLPDMASMGMFMMVGPSASVDVLVGRLVVEVWRRKDRRGAEEFMPVAGAAMICADSAFLMPGLMFQVNGYAPPMCLNIDTREGRLVNLNCYLTRTCKAMLSY